MEQELCQTRDEKHVRRNREGRRCSTMVVVDVSHDIVKICDPIKEEGRRESKPVP
jgi:hypothetical protein